MDLDTRISLQKLELLCAVVEAGGVTKAAERLYMSQPVVTSHMQTLEKRLGVRIFQRAGRGVEITAAGEAVYAWAKEMMTRSHEMYREIEGLSSGARGSAAIAAGVTPGTFILPKMLVTFMRDNPESRITMTQAAPELALESVSVGDADVAVVGGNQLVLERTHLHHEQVRDEDLLLVASPEYDIADSVTVSEMAHLRYVCSPGHGSMRRAVVEQALSSAGVGPRNIVLALEHPTAIRYCVEQSVGVAVLLRSSVQDALDNGSLRQVAISDAAMSIPLFIVFRRDKRFTPLQQRLMTHLHNELGPVTTDPRPEP